MAKPAYRRILLKLSGEAFMGEQKTGIEQRSCQQIAQSIKDVCALGVQIGLVVGGGNIFRGNQAQEFGFARTPADHVGMLATTVNGLVLQQALSHLGVKSHVLSAFPIGSFVEPYSWERATQLLQQGVVVIFVGGTGSPYFTTDSAAALRASEMEVGVLLKATTVNGVYTEDPKKNPRAKKFDRLSYADVLCKQLKVMDATAVALCRDNRIPICVCSLSEPSVLLKAVCGESVGTWITGE